MQDQSAFEPIDNFIDDNMCFACGSQNPFGLHMQFYSNGTVIRSELVIPKHMCGWGDLVHGGIISTLLDEIMSWSAIHLLHKMILTRTMQVAFIRPVAPLTRVRIEGWIDQQVKNTEAVVKGSLFDENDQACATSEGHFALLSAKMMRRMKIMDEPTVAQFERRYEQHENELSKR